MVSIVSYFNEKGISVRDKISSMALPVRWALLYAGILVVVFLGAYGLGYTTVDMIYAGY